MVLPEAGLPKRFSHKTGLTRTPVSHSEAGFTSNRGQGSDFSTRAAKLPAQATPRPARPWLATTTRSTSPSRTAATISRPA